MELCLPGQLSCFKNEIKKTELDNLDCPDACNGIFADLRIDKDGMKTSSDFKSAKIHYILFYLDCGIYVGYYDFWDLMWDKCGIVCQIIVCRKISTKMWDKCGIWEKVEHKQIVRDSLCGMNVGLVCVLPCWRCWVDVGFSLVPIIFIIFSAFYRT